MQSVIGQDIMQYQSNNMKLFLLIIFFLSTLSQTLARTYCGLSPEVTTVFYNTTSKLYRNDGDSSGDDVIEFNARMCPCSNILEYCHIGTGSNMCSVHRWSRDPVLETLCFRQTPLRRFLGLVYLPSVFMLVLVSVMTCTTVIGKNAMVYFFSICFPCLRNKQVNIILQNEIAAITEHIHLTSLANQREDGKVERITLKLKTKPVNQDHQFTFEDKNCLICMMTFEEGDKIADMSCRHNFHVDCMKEWLKRKNVCPLCNAQVAETEVLLVEPEDILSGEDGGEIDDEARARFERMTNFYSRRTSRRLRSQFL